MTLDDLSPTRQMVYKMFKKQDGSPILLSENQDILFSSIFSRKYDRMHVMCHTRWGKSLTVGLSVLMRAALFPEKWAIIAAKKPKAQIIMDYVIGHIFDNEFTKSRFLPDKGDSIDDIRRARNKKHITFRVGDNNGVPVYGEVFIGSAEDALGFGAPNVILDEAALVSDDDFALVMRMLGDSLDDSFLCKIGNPFTRGHFLESYHDPRYKIIDIDCYASLKDGRITQEIIEENRMRSFFSIMFEDKFPSAREVDQSGWMYLFTDDDIKKAQNRKVESAGRRRLGHDVARGGRNWNTWTLRTDNFARLLDKDHCDDLTKTGDKTINFAKDLGVRPEDVFIDDTGVGGGEVDYLKNQDFNATAVTLGGSAKDPMMANVRAEIYAGDEGLMNWMKRGGSIEPNAGWIELTKIRYRKNSQSKTVIESKDDMLKQGTESPDIADSLALTFANSGNTSYYGINQALRSIGFSSVPRNI